MVLVRRVRRRGANIVVEANAEVLFAPIGQIGRWTRRFTERVKVASAAAAPVNKRPRWAHYGKPLKATMRGSTTYQPGRMKVYSAVGSTAPHAYYVDQGTGIYAGNGPYKAEVLPPWHRGSPSLYEATWRPAGPGGRRVKAVYIKGQKGQFFFDEGLKRGFQSMRMRSYQVPGEGGLGQILNSVPTGIADFLGNTPPDAGFRASLAEWRAWRDAAWRGEAGAFGSEGLVRRRFERAAAKIRADKVRASKKHGLPAKAEKALADEIKRLEKIEASRREARERNKQAEEARKKRDLAKIRAAQARTKAKADRERAEKERAAEETRSRINARRKREATELARKYANAGYTGVRLRTDFNKHHTAIIGYTVFFTSPSGATDSVKFH